MPQIEKIKILLDEKFPHLKKAPIIEAVIDIRTHSRHPFEEKEFRQKIENKIKGYHFLDIQKTFLHGFKIEKGAPSEQKTEDLGIKGIRFKSEDSQKICQFNRDGFVFSWLGQYPDWETFVNEAISFWRLYKEIRPPNEINRIGLRYINRIELCQDNIQLGEFIQQAPEAPKCLELPFSWFMHHETLAIPGHDYAINLIKTIQPPQDIKQNAGIIIDIDVFTTQDNIIEENKIAIYLDEMRWLKNKTFFGTITEKALEDFK
jgi:uncharacterized protein (TIGR04255 family)